MRPLTIAVALLLVTLAAPAGAQHAHDGAEARVLITHDVAEDGETYVGNLNHFGWVQLDEQQQPVFHRNAAVEVLLNGQTLWATTPASGHDYDGVASVAIAFPVTGHYEVRVTVPTQDGDLVGSFNGTVVKAPTSTVQLDATVPDVVAFPDELLLDYAVVHENGTLVEHSDVDVAIVDAKTGRAYLRTHTHGHGERQQVHAQLPAGSYVVHLTGYQAFPSKSAATFAPVMASFPLTVDGGALDVGVPHAPSEVPLTNRAESTSGDGPYRLAATYDPYTSIGPQGRMHLEVLTLDAMGELVPHVDVEAELIGPNGERRFASETLHEYDGVFSLEIGPDVIGDYTLTTTVTKGAWQETIEHHFSVVPPHVPLGAGVQFVEIDGLDTLVAGEPSDLEVFVHDRAGLPFQHGELDLIVLDGATGHVVVKQKLHTHADGRFPFTFTPATQGPLVFRVDPMTVAPAPVPAFYGPNIGDGLDFAAIVADGPGLTPVAVDEPLEIAETTEETPMPALVAALAVLAAGAFARRRR